MAAFRFTDLATPPGWAVAAVVAILALIYIFCASRYRMETPAAALARLVAALMAAVAAWWLIGQWGRYDYATAQRARDARALELTAQATRPGSNLACLDGVAGELVEQACEGTLFASPQSTAAAVSYVTAQIALLVSGSEELRSGAPSAALADVRRAVEADSFGIVAHVLATRDGCTVAECATFALFKDTSRISANLVERPFEARVKSAMANWPTVADRLPVADSGPPAAAAAAAATPPVAAARAPNNLYFPSASSIPPVNIMTAEPSSAPQQGGREATGTANAAPPPLPPRRPPSGAASAREPQAGNSNARPLTPPAPPAQ